MNAPSSNDPDWKKIAEALGERLAQAIVHGNFRNLKLATGTGKSHSMLDYLVDGLEMIPGTKVNRERLHMTPAQRRKDDAAKAQAATLAAPATPKRIGEK